MAHDRGRYERAELLILLDLHERLPRRYGVIIIPEAVARELSHPRSRGAIRAWAAAPPPWLRIMSVAPLQELELDAGESEAIPLALELGVPLLVDDAAARSAALRWGIPVVGTLGFLARESDLDLDDMIARLLELGFRATPELIKRVRAAN